MAKDINLISKEWNDIIFDGKHKEYGAYDMRKSSSKRHIIAFLISLGIVIFVTLLPLIISEIEKRRPAPTQASDDTVLANLQKELEEQVQEKDIIREETAPPPPPLKSTIQFTAPEIVESDKITEDDEIKSQDDLADSKVQISVSTVEGTDEEFGIDIADLEQHKVIVEEETKVHIAVEQMPEFPGGQSALLTYLSQNIKYPAEAADNGISGRVILRFVINKNGEVKDITVISGVDPLLDKEAIRVVASMPKWVAGKQNGKTVNVYYNLPVVFRLMK